jgi:hypothetical protein
MSAACVAVALVASPTLAGILGLHLALEHQHHDGRGSRADAAAFAAVLHGHAHDEGTPEHDHRLTDVARTSAATSLQAPQARPASMTVLPSTPLLRALDGPAEWGGPSGAGPPPEHKPVLRI